MKRFSVALLVFLAAFAVIARADTVNDPQVGIGDPSCFVGAPGWDSAPFVMSTGPTGQAQFVSCNTTATTWTSFLLTTSNSFGIGQVIIPPETDPNSVISCQVGVANPAFSTCDVSLSGDTISMSFTGGDGILAGHGFIADFACHLEGCQAWPANHEVIGTPIVPEPASALLLLSGVGVLWHRRRVML